MHLARLEGLLESIEWLKGWNVLHTGAKSEWDLVATLPLPFGGQARLLVESKRELHPSQFSLLSARTQGAARCREGAVPVLALPHVTPRMAEIAQQHGWSWFDLAGNCRLDVPGLLYIERTGIPPVHQAPRTAANLSSAEAGRVLRALLAPQQAGRSWTQRELQSECDPAVSLGLVNKLVQRLRNEAFIEDTPESGFRLRDPAAALATWATAYRFERHSRRGYFTLLQGRKLVEALARWDGVAGTRSCYASFSAADFQAPHVRQPRTWLYLMPELEEAFRTQVQAKPVDSGENLVVLFPEDEGVFYLPDRGPDRLGATNPVQTYIDLLHSGGRGVEAAAALLEQRLLPAWRAGATS